MALLTRLNIRLLLKQALRHQICMAICPWMTWETWETREILATQRWIILLQIPARMAAVVIMLTAMATVHSI